MDWKRMTSSILGIPMVIVVLFLGNKWIIDVAFAVVALIAIHEYFQAFHAYKPIQWVGYMMAITVSCIHLLPFESLLLCITFGIPVIVAILFIILVIHDLKISVIDIAITLFGIIYIVLFTMFLPLVAGADNGIILIWYVIIAAWGSDVFAFMTGNTLKLGKHKFSKISPNKSVEGCIAGVIGSIALTLYFTVLLNLFHIALPMSYAKVVIISIILSILGQFGDFAASSIKRFVGIKDFSNLIPGHGGLLDRIDSLIFIAPFAYILLVLI